MVDKVKDRLEPEIIHEQAMLFQSMELLSQAFDSTNVMVVIINSFRQIVFINKCFEKLVNRPKEEVIGRRPGEVVSCIYSTEGRDGCGTAKGCRSCNALSLMQKAIEKKDTFTGEAFITQISEGSQQPLSLIEHVVPVRVGDEYFYILSFTDISDTVKKRTMERIFFHDVLNTAGALKGLIEMMKNELPTEYREEVGFVENAFQYMIEEIQCQKQLLDAENSELAVYKVTLVPHEIMNSVVRLYEKHEMAENKRIITRYQEGEYFISSDYNIIRRVLGNMVKNALEATEREGIVYVGIEYHMDKREIEFYIENGCYIEPDMQLRIFQKSFSTKGRGRGSGTYSMKLLGEKYLGGQVGFVSERSSGTRFFLRIPAANY